MKYIEMHKLASDRLLGELFYDEGFYLKKGWQIQNIYFEKKIDDHRILGFSCGFAKYGDMQTFQGMSGRINFLEIESIVRPLLNKYELMGNGKITDSTTCFVNYESMGLEGLKNPPLIKSFQINNEVDVDYLVEMMKNYYLNFVKIGFEKFTSIEQFVPLIKNLDKLDFVGLSKILGQFAIMKKAIIFKLCNIDEYETFINGRIEAFHYVINNGNTDVDKPKWLNAFIELKQILDNTPPIYNI